MTRTLGVAALLAALATIACSRSSEQPRPDTAPTPGAAATSSPAPVEQGTPAAPAPDPSASASAPHASATAPTGPIPVPVTSALARAAESSVPLSFNDATVVDPASRFHVEAAVALTDARLSLVDADDAMIAAAESHEIGATWSRFTLVPDAPLRPGSTYTLRLDGAAEREAHDSDGRAYQVATWPIRVAGEPPPPEKPAPRGKRR